MRYKPKVGEDFPLKDVIIAKARYLTELTRSLIALSVIMLCVLVLLMTAASSVYRGDFHVLQTVWAVVAAPMGWIIGHYFRGKHLE